jgi:DNA-binding transcriptional ArsR family regulator
MSIRSRDPRVRRGVTSDRSADLAGALTDPRRLDLLRALRRSPATVNELAAGLGLRPATTSVQLARLRRAGLARELRRGRHRIYSVDPDRVGRLLDALDEASGIASVPAPHRRPTPGSALWIARTCYDHLAGTAGVELADGLEGSGWVLRGAHDFLVTDTGERQLVRRGVDVAACREARRKLAPGCLDWTERRPHVGGALGAAILRSLTEQGYVTLGTDRAVGVRRPIAGWIRGRGG